MTHLKVSSDFGTEMKCMVSNRAAVPHPPIGNEKLSLGALILSSLLIILCSFFIQQIFIEHLPCARHCTYSLG